MSSRVVALWHFDHSTAEEQKWYEVVFRVGMAGLWRVGRFVRAFLEVEPIFLKRF